ncbi:MAG: hypothetical protein ACOC6S_03295 [Chloroflexota bacterium]
MADLLAYSVKVDPEDLERAKKFCNRQGVLLQDIVRGVIRMASGCESCLALAESNAPVEQVQSSMAAVLADAQQTWRLNGLFQDTIFDLARRCNIQEDFITNVLAEAQRQKFGRGSGKTTGEV